MLQKKKQNMLKTLGERFIYPVCLARNVLPDFEKRERMHPTKVGAEEGAKSLCVTPKFRVEQKVSLENGSGKLQTSFFARCSPSGNQELYKLLFSLQVPGCYGRVPPLTLGACLI